MERATVKKQAKKIKKVDLIMTILEKSKQPKTVREICDALHYPKEDAKFVSSSLILKRASKVVKKKLKVCSITGHRVDAYALRA